MVYYDYDNEKYLIAILIMGTKERKKKGIGEWEFICLFKILLR
jgi:hypothetical protein